MNQHFTIGKQIGWYQCPYSTPQNEQLVRVGVNDGVVLPSYLSICFSAKIAAECPNVAALIHNSFAFGTSRSVPSPFPSIYILLG